MIHKALYDPQSTPEYQLTFATGYTVPQSPD